MSESRKFQVTVRVDADADLTDSEWDDVGDDLESKIADIYISSIEHEGYCGECGEYEERTIDVSVSNVDVITPVQVREGGVIGLPR